LRVFCLSSHRKSRLEPDQKHDLDKTAVLSESGLCGQLQLNIVQCERVEERGWRGLGETGSGQLTAAMRIEPLSFMGSVRESFGDFHGQRPENRRLPAKKCGQGHFPNKKCGSCSTFLWITPAKRVPDAIRTHDLPLRRRTLYPAELRKHAPFFGLKPWFFGLGYGCRSMKSPQISGQFINFHGQKV
jgi:hypothetical protein